MEEATSALNYLFDPKSVAVVGASTHYNKWGYALFFNVIRSFRGRVYAVNQRGAAPFGYKAYRRVTEIPDDVDLVAIIVPAQSVPEVMEDCADKGVKVAVVITAGFRETGEEGRRLEEDMLRAARRGGVRIVGPNCMGVWSSTSNLNALMTPIDPLDGSIACVSQGGNIGVSILGFAERRGVGLSRYVSCGETTDVQVEDYIEWFGHDPKTKVIIAYIEGVSDGRRFLEKVRRVAPRKPVIALKSGKSEKAAKAIGSHIGAVAGSHEIYRAAFRQAGIITVDDLPELFDVATAFLTQPLPRGNRVGIYTAGGSWGVVATDACIANGLNVVDLPREVIEEIDKLLPPRWSKANPVDSAGDRNWDNIRKVPEVLLRSDAFDALLLLGFVGDSSWYIKFSEDIPEAAKDMVEKDEANIEAMVKWRKEYPKPIIVATFSEEERLLLRLRERGVFAYPTPERAAKVLAKLVEYKQFLEKLGS